MPELKFYIVDVFAESKFSGNQLAVFRDVGDLSVEMMQVIAKEMDFAETTFIKSDAKGKCGYDVRIFTPEEELPFAGHPTLGASFIINSMILSKPVDLIEICLKVGSIPVKIDKKRGDNFLWMKQNRPELLGEVDKELIAEVLSLEVEEIDERFPVMEVSTGTPFIIVPLKRLHAVKRARNNVDAYFELIEKNVSKAIYLFAPESEDEGNEIHARLFADYYGVAEDAATGSAAGCLAGYLVHHKFFDSSEIDLKVEQGYMIGRKSLLHLKAKESEREIEVNVGGRVQMIAEGTMKI